MLRNLDSIYYIARSSKNFSTEINSSENIFLVFRGLITFLLFVRSQCLIARNVCELFSYNRGLLQSNEACCINELSRGFVLGYEILKNN